MCQQIWTAREGVGSSRPWSSVSCAMAQVSFRARNASCEANLQIAGNDRPRHGLNAKSARVFLRRCRPEFYLRFADRGWHSGLACLFLHIVEFLLGIVERLLFICDLLFVLRVLLVPIPRVAQSVAYVRVHSGGAYLVFPLKYVKFPAQQIDLFLLLRKLFSPLLGGGVLGGLIHLRRLCFGSGLVLGGRSGGRILRLRLIPIFWSRYLADHG